MGAGARGPRRRRRGRDTRGSWSSAWVRRPTLEAPQPRRTSACAHRESADYAALGDSRAAARTPSWSRTTCSRRSKARCFTAARESVRASSSSCMTTSCTPGRRERAWDSPSACSAADVVVAHTNFVAEGVPGACWPGRCAGDSASRPGRDAASRGITGGDRQLRLTACWSRRRAAAVVQGFRQVPVARVPRCRRLVVRGDGRRRVETATRN